MKKFIFAVLLIFLAQPGFSVPVEGISDISTEAEPIQCSITFDWIGKSQLKRDEDIKNIQSLIFNDKTITKYQKDEFKAKYAEFRKNKNYINDYDEISNGKKQDDEKNYCGFFKGKILIAYGIQYKNNLNNSYYYDAMGSLRWIDTFSENYPVFPYWSYQYTKDGKLVAAYYYLSDEDQYVFDEKKTFRGRWYKENLYNSKAKIIMTRSSY